MMRGLDVNVNVATMRRRMLLGDVEKLIAGKPCPDVLCVALDVAAHVIGLMASDREMSERLLADAGERLAETVSRDWEKSRGYRRRALREAFGDEV